MLAIAVMIIGLLVIRTILQLFLSKISKTKLTV